MGAPANTGTDAAGAGTGSIGGAGEPAAGFVMEASTARSSKITSREESILLPAGSQHWKVEVLPCTMPIKMQRTDLSANPDGWGRMST